MIPEAFILCAMALPPILVPSKGRHYDVGLFRFIVKNYRTFHPEIKEDDSTAYMIGGDTDLLFMLRQSAIKSWRVTIHPNTPYDIVAYPENLPFQRENSLLVIYMAEVLCNPWSAMQLWSEATAPLSQGGVIAFYEQIAPFFTRMAKSQEWEHLPTQWYGMDMWRKPHPFHRHQLTQMRSS